MQRPEETQGEHYFELTNVDGAHLYMNTGSEGSAREYPKPVLMRTTTGKNDNENPSKERPVQGAAYSEVTANSNSVIIQGAEQASLRLKGSDTVLDSLNVITQTMQQQMDLFRRMMYPIALLLVITLLTAAVSVGLIVKTSRPRDDRVSPPYLQVSRVVQRTIDLTLKIRLSSKSPS